MQRAAHLSYFPLWRCNMPMEIKAGETLRFDCPECSAEFDVTYEPKCAGDGKEAKKAANDTEPCDVTTCPFCGVELEGEDDTSDE